MSKPGLRLVSVFLVLLSACGQKPGVGESSDDSAVVRSELLDE